MDEKMLTTHSLKQIIDRMYPDNINKTSVVSMLKAIKKHRKISAREIADLILYIADTQHRHWNIEVILNSINETNDSINWRGVYEKFIEEDLKIWNMDFLYTLIDCWVHISGIITVPYEIFFRKWKTKENQIEFLKLLLESDEKRTQVYSNIFFEKIITKDELRNTKYKKTIEYESNLNSVELFMCIKEIEASELIELIKERSPEYCVLGLAAVQPYQEDVYDSLLINYCESSASHFIHHILFDKYKEKMLYSFKRISDRVSITRILDIFLEHKMLPVVTEVVEPRDFCFDLIILSSRRDHLNLEVWVGNNFKRLIDSFVIYMHNKLLTKVNQNDKTLCLKGDSEIFPFNKSIIISVLKIIENKEIPGEIAELINDIKLSLTDQVVLDVPNVSDRATSFISEIINSQVDVDQSIFKLKELIRGNENDLNMAKKILGMLIDNYSSLHKLPNSDTVALFFGELIKKKVFLKPFMEVAMQLIKNSLKFPETDREYSFAFRVLEIFFNENPQFLSEIENIDSVRNSLIRKELILIDEDSQAHITLIDLMCTILNIKKNQAELIQLIESIAELKEQELTIEKILNKSKALKSVSHDQQYINQQVSCSQHYNCSQQYACDKQPNSCSQHTSQCQHNSHNQFNSHSQHTSTSQFNSHSQHTSTSQFGSYNAVINSGRPGTYLKNSRLDGSIVFSDESGISNLGFSYSSFYIFVELNNLKIDSFVRFVLKEIPEFREYIVEIGFTIIKNCFIYKIDNEIEYYKTLGTFLGKLVVAQNKAVTANVFDFKNFILKSIEYRRITVCTYVVVNFFKEGSRGITCVPNNPWLLSILELLSELHSCTLVHIREHIQEIFKHFNIKLISKSSSRMKDHLDKYTIEYEGFQRQIIATALDFSVREVCHKIVKSALSTARTTALAIFNLREELNYFTVDEAERRDRNSSRFFLFRNLIVNLVRAIIHFTAQEPLKASLCGNITHFLKLSSNEIPFDEVSKIAALNLKICCSLVEKVGITQANEIAQSLYNEHLRIIEKNCESMKIADKNEHLKIADKNESLKIADKNEHLRAVDKNESLRTVDKNSNETMRAVDKNEHLKIVDKNNEIFKIGDKNENLKTINSNENLKTINNNENTRIIDKSNSSTVNKPTPAVNSIKSLKILSESVYVEKTNIRTIENSEYQDLKSFLVQMGRKMPLKKKDYISEEWQNLLAKDRKIHYKNIMEHIKSSSDKDSQCLSLCKYLIGHFIKTECKEDFIFDYIADLLTFSNKTKIGVLGWLIYSEDSKRYNVTLIKKFIEYGLIYLDEYDHALSKSLKGDDQKIMGFVIDLLSALMLTEVRLCTVYDFIQTIETLNKLNDNPRVNDFFKQIEQGIMKFGENSSEIALFEDFVNNIRCAYSADVIAQKFKEKLKNDNFGFRSYLKSSWNHFVLYTGSYRFYKIDILAMIIKDNLAVYLKEALSYLVQAYSKRHYLFFTFFCRFILKILDNLEDTPDNRLFITKLLELISPVKLPGFTSQFIQIVNHGFVSKILEKQENFFIFIDLLNILKYNTIHEHSITRFFVNNAQASKKYNLYLSYLCPQSCVNLKNLFNQSRPKGMLEKATNPYFTAFSSLSKLLRVNTNYETLIDNLNEQNSITSHVIGCLKYMIDKNINTKEIVLLLLSRASCENVPAGIKIACDEIFIREDIKPIVAEYRMKYFNKS